jgi:hypothetical protein
MVVVIVVEAAAADVVDLLKQRNGISREGV